MARKRFQTILGTGFINSATYSSPTTLTEPITGAPQLSSTYVGDFDELTHGEAAKLSNTTIGTLYEGMYQLVCMDSGASFGANLKQGQILWWVLNGTYTHQVTNVEPTGKSMVAGFYTGPVGTNAAAPSATNQFFFMQCFSEGIASVLMRTTLSNSGPAQGDSIFTAGAGAGTDNSTADDLGGSGTAPTLANVANYIGRFLGIAEAAPVGAALTKIEVRGGFIRP